jgi:hypothetical protein
MRTKRAVDRNALNPFRFDLVSGFSSSCGRHLEICFYAKKDIETNKEVEMNVKEMCLFFLVEKRVKKYEMK